MNSTRFDINSLPRYSFLSAPKDKKKIHLQYDVVIIGSGAGGSVVAAELAKEGKRVLICEKGMYVHQENLSLLESDATRAMFERQGVLITEDGGVSVFAGSTFGGGNKKSIFFTWFL